MWGLVGGGGGWLGEMDVSAGSIPYIRSCNISKQPVVVSAVPSFSAQPVIVPAVPSLSAQPVVAPAVPSLSTRLVVAPAGPTLVVARKAGLKALVPQERRRAVL